jgi:hypothetical protein
MKRENGSFIQNWVGWTREIGQHDNGYIILVINGQRATWDEMADDGGQSIRMSDVEACDWR